MQGVIERYALGRPETQYERRGPHRFLHGAEPLKPLPRAGQPRPALRTKQAHVAGLIDEYRLVA